MEAIKLGRLNKEEKEIIYIFRLVKKINVKFSIGYYSIQNTPEHLNKHYYFPNIGHKYFGTARETIKSLKNILTLSYAEFMEHLTEEKRLKTIAQLKSEKTAIENKIKRLEEERQ